MQRDCNYKVSLIWNMQILNEFANIGTCILIYLLQRVMAISWLELISFF